MIRLQPSKRLASLGTMKAQIRTPPETPRTSHHYGIEWYKEEGPQSGPTMPILGQ